MSRFVLFDLDNTLVDSLHLKTLRDQRRWPEVYRQVHTITTFPGIVDLWIDLRAHRYHMGIVTHSPRSYAQRVLDQVGLKPDLLVAYHDLRGCRKPSPFGYQECSAGHAPNCGIAIGDERNDLLAADAFGCLGVFAGWSRNPSLTVLECERAGWEFATQPAAVLRFLEELTAS